MTRKFLGFLAAAGFLGLASTAQAGAVYPVWKQEVEQATANTSLGGTVKCQLATASYTYSAANVFLSDVTGLVGSPVTLTSKTFVNGKFSSAAVTFTAVTVGSTVTQDICWVDTGTAGTSRLVVNNTGFSVVTNGGDIVLTPDVTNGWFSL